MAVVAIVEAVEAEMDLALMMLVEMNPVGIALMVMADDWMNEHLLVHS